MAENPYEPPRTDGKQSSAPKGRQIAIGVLLILLSVPAGAIAFLTTCAIGLNFDEAGVASMIVALVTGAAAFGGVIYFAVRWLRKP